MISVLIIDDEALARQRVRKLLEERSDVTIIQECRNGKEAIEAISNKQPDLIFLDIQMKDMTKKRSSPHTFKSHLKMNCTEQHPVI